MTILNIMIIPGLSGVNGVGVNKRVVNCDSVNANRIILSTVTLLILISHEVNSSFSWVIPKVDGHELKWKVYGS